MVTAQHVLDFWFKELSAEDWWKKDIVLDQRIAERFGEAHQTAVRGEYYIWRTDIRGRLAEIIILDQFSRNIFRDQPQAFAQDGMALALAQEAVAAGLDRQLQAAEKAFLYLPYMHSESPQIHTEAVKLFSQPGLEGNLDFEYRHKAIIDRFGRYPHRNAILGRVSTVQETQFLTEPGSSF